VKYRCKACKSSSAKQPVAPEVKPDPEVKLEQPEIKPDPEVKPDPEIKQELEIKQEPEPFSIRGYFGLDR
jgi:hypothetical protein